MSLSATVVISTHDRPEHLRRSVEAVLAQRLPAAELIVVKDAPGPVAGELAEMAGQAGVGFAAIYADRPSLPASRNLGMDRAAGDIVLLLDDDMILPPDFLGELLSLYEADPDGVVAGIGAVAARSTPRAWPERMWDALAHAVGQGRWGPRRCAARSLRLPVGLRGRLVAARRLSGGTISLRRAVAKVERFEGSFEGYALAEDREFCYRVGVRHGLFLCPSLQVAHEIASGGRPDMVVRGRMYIAHTLHIASHAAGGGAGTYLIVACELVGIAGLHVAWLGLGDRRAHWGFLRGMCAELLGQLRRGIRRCLCGY